MLWVPTTAPTPHRPLWALADGSGLPNVAPPSASPRAAPAPSAFEQGSSPEGAATLGGMVEDLCHCLLEVGASRRANGVAHGRGHLADRFAP